MKKLIVLLCFGMVFHVIHAQELIATWSFNQIVDGSVVEDVSKKSDKIVGFFDPAEGIREGAILFDGFTSFLER